MMKIFTFLVAVFTCTALNAQIDYIWGGENDPNSTFEGGLNGWTTQGFSGGVENTDGVWVWEADGKADLGAYSGKADALPIESPSVANGAMVFDSDFYDNAGTPGNFGNGVAPAPQVGYLTSPVMDCSGRDAVTLKFNQYTRNFQSTYFVEVSTDGAEWTQFQVNAGLEVNQRGGRDELVFVDISSVAANQSTVQVRFAYNANYYYWILDDVSLVVTPENDVRMTMASNPTIAKVLPLHSVNTFPFEFQCALENYIGSTPVNVTLKANILDDTQNSIFETTKELVGVANDGSADTVKFDEIIDVSEISNIFTKEGEYSIVYSLESAGVSYNTADDVITLPFTVTNSTFNTNPARRGWAFGDAQKFTVANLYKMGELADNHTFVCDKLVGGVVSNNEAETVTASTTSRIYLLDASINDDLGNWDNEKKFKDDSKLTEIGNGYAVMNKVPFREAPNYGYYTHEIINSETEEETIMLEGGARYFATVELEIKDLDDKAIFAYSSNGNNFGSKLASLVETANDIGATGGINWNIELNVQDIVSTVETKELASNTLTVFPTVAQNTINVAIELPQNEDKVTLVVRDLMGKMISYETLHNVSSRTHEMNISNLTSGQYTVQMLIKDGYKTQKFVVAK